MIATVTLNAALDRTLHIGRLEAGRVHLVGSDHAQAGGKGVNVARVLKALGVPTTAIVVVGGATGDTILRDLAKAELTHVAIQAGGESRTCLEIVERGTARATQLHGRGVEPSASTLDEVVEAVLALPEAVTWVAISGSLPPGMPVDATRRLVEAARSRGWRVAIDTRGPALGEAWSTGPDVVRVNREDLAEVLGSDHDSLRKPPFSELASPVLGIVSAGRQPFASWREDGQRFRVTPPSVTIVNPIGSGDAMLAGFLASLEAGSAYEDSLRRATALATAEAMSPIAGCPDIALAQSLEPKVQITKAA